MGNLLFGTVLLSLVFAAEDVVEVEHAVDEALAKWIKRALTWLFAGQQLLYPPAQGSHMVS